MTYKKIIIEKNFLPSKKIEIEFEEFKKSSKKYFKPQLIFARNGMGKTTLSNEIDEKGDVEEVESIFRDSSNQSYQITNEDIVYTIRIDSEDRFTSIGDDAIFISDDYIAENVNIIDREINRLEDGLKTSVEFLLRRGGSRKSPDDMLVRELPRFFGLTIGSFNKGKSKLNLYASPIEILRDISKVFEFFTTEESDEKLAVYNKLKNGIDNIIQSEKFKLQSDFIDEVSNNFQLSEELQNSLNDKLTNSENSNTLDGFITQFKDILLFLENLKKELLEQITEDYSKRLNQEFSKIFFDTKRLQIDKKGKIFSRDDVYGPVPYTKLSTAEKNIINLVYSFLELENLIKYRDLKSLLVVIDDPISSIDYSNKVGLYTFFRNKIESLSSMYSETKFIICTHDEEIYYHFYKIFDDLKCYHQKRKNISCLELTYEGLIKRESEYNFYKQQINSIYKYALGLEPDLSLYIGNTMRRVLEAYSTFNYNLGPSQISTDQELLSKIQDETEREFFKAYMYRLILNSDSHASDRVRRSSSNFSEMFSDEEKIRTAQLLLGFLYRLDPVHIERMIDSEEFKKEITKDDQLNTLDEVGSKIEMWLKSIK
ncbi:AAA family ATPase [Streptococcus oralis]|uniref:AAA family ATPase n=1 Tax=Streptococcus oralis TaxID=1303 RepID=UPI001CBBDA7A|nr:AAA family ATPase [Streptococcus oralis]MBZ2086610.1 AAA family ATPase [Streptococcus oralis]